MDVEQLSGFSDGVRKLCIRNPKCQICEKVMSVEKFWLLLVFDQALTNDILRCVYFLVIKITQTSQGILVLRPWFPHCFVAANSALSY